MGLLSWLTGDGRDANAMWDNLWRWLESQGADRPTVRSTKYEDRKLSENHNVIICVGTYRKNTEPESYAYYVEISKDTSQVVLGRSFFPGGIGTWHKSDSKTARRQGRTLYAIMVEAEKRNHEEFPENKDHLS